MKSRWQQTFRASFKLSDNGLFSFFKTFKVQLLRVKKKNLGSVVTMRPIKFLRSFKDQQQSRKFIKLPFYNPEGLLSLNSNLIQGFVAAPVRCIYFEIKGQPTYHTSSFKFSLKEGKYNLTLQIIKICHFYIPGTTSYIMQNCSFRSELYFSSSLVGLRAVSIQLTIEEV